MVEVKMLLPMIPPMGIMVYGHVVRVSQADGDGHEVAIHFSDISEEVRDEIIRYALSRQREVLRSRRQQLEKDAG